MESFSLHDGYLCKNKFNGLRHKVDVSGLDADQQKRVVDTLNARKEELKIVKYATTKLKIYFISNHAYLERFGDGRVALHDLPPLSQPARLQWNHIC